MHKNSVYCILTRSSKNAAKFKQEGGGIQLQNNHLKTVFLGVYYQIADDCTAIFFQKDSGDVSMLQHFVLLPTFLILELSSNCIDQISFNLTMDVLGQHYVPNCTY